MLLKSVGRLTSLFFVFLFWSSTALAWDVSLPTTSTSGNYTVSWPVDDYTFTYSLKEKVGSGSLYVSIVVASFDFSLTKIKGDWNDR